MITPLLAGVVLQYAFPVGTPVHYDVSVTFSGYVPIFGGKQSEVDVKMGVDVEGAAPDGEGNAKAISEIKEMHLLLKGQELPFDAKAIQRYFPKTTISMSPLGKVLKTDAPDRTLPVRLPGLHAKRFPDITYVPLELPADGVEVGKAFTFKKPFGDSVVDYEVTPTAITDADVSLAIKLHQNYTLFEDKFGNQVEEKDAATKIPTQVDGSGTATFDRKRQIISKMSVEADALGTVTDLKSGATSARNLKTKLNVVAQKLPQTVTR